MRTVILSRTIGDQIVDVAQLSLHSGNELVEAEVLTTNQDLAAEVSGLIEKGFGSESLGRRAYLADGSKFLDALRDQTSRTTYWSSRES